LSEKVNNTNDVCARETLRPWLIGIAILICATIALAICYADDIRQAQINRMSLKQKSPPGLKGRRTAGTSGRLAAFVPPWHNKQNPDAITGATPVAMSFSEAIGIISPSVVGINTTGTQEQGGSGIIVHPMGYVLTNHHVIRDAKNILVTVATDQMFKTYSAEVVEIKADMDLAMVRLLDTGRRKFTPAPLGDSSRIRIGQQVVAIGSPFGLSQSASAGIVSNTNRTLTAGDKVFKDLIQTDASINPGSSGGALANTEAEIIGINTAIYSPTMSFSGIGFAVPINQARRAFRPFIQTVKSPLANKATSSSVKGNINGVANAASIGGVNVKMVAGRRMPRKPCWLGVDIFPVDSTVAREFNVPFHGGVLVNHVFPNSPSGLAGLQRGDIMFRIDGRRVKDQDMLWSYLATKRNGEQVELTLFRNGRRKTAIAVLEPEPANVNTLLQKNPTGPVAGNTALIDEISWIGIDIQPIGPGNDAQKFGLDPATKGVFIGEVEGIAAIEAGLQPGDVIRRINGSEVENIQSFKNIIKRVDPSKGVVLDIMRQKRPYYITIHSAKQDQGAWQ
jgi:serine protease Do